MLDDQILVEPTIPLDMFLFANLPHYEFRLSYEYTGFLAGLMSTSLLTPSIIKGILFVA